MPDHLGSSKLASHPDASGVESGAHRGHAGSAEQIAVGTPSLKRAGWKHRMPPYHVHILIGFVNLNGSTLKTWVD